MYVKVNTKMRNFRNLLIWKKAIEITSDVYLFSITLPSEEKFGIRSQITRAAVSMPSNIAEGCSRRSAKEYVHFLEISLGSSFELETQLLICQLINIGNHSLADKILINLSDLQRMLNVYSNKIFQNSTNNHLPTAKS